MLLTDRFARSGERPALRRATLPVPPTPIVDREAFARQVLRSGTCSGAGGRFQTPSVVLSRLPD